MSFRRSELKKRTKIILAVIAAILLAAVIGVFIYINDYYKANDTAVSAMAGTASVTVETDGKYTFFKPESATVGFIFYPGGKVEHTAYAPLLLELAENGILTVLVEMPARLAVLDSDAADGVTERFPDIGAWYIGGHSLGGSMAASYLADNAEDFRGLVLLAAYSTDDLSDTGLSILSLYGTEDRVLNLEKYGKYYKNLPRGTNEVVLEGANHAGFGSYGAQDGDGKATISGEEQRALTVEYILKFLEN